MKKILLPIISLIIGLSFTSTAIAARNFNPYITIAAVVADQTVSITGNNFPANDTFRVTLGYYGSYGIGGPRVPERQMTRPLITVFGATGAQGGGLAAAILGDPQRRFGLRAVTRYPDSAAALSLAWAGAEVVAADLDDEASVGRAMQGTHGAFCMTGSWEHRSPERELRQAHHRARAARDAGVGHVVWSTLEDTRDFIAAGAGHLPLLAGRYNVPHYDVKGEANHAFVACGVPTTFLYTSFRWECLAHPALMPTVAAHQTAMVLHVAQVRPQRRASAGARLP